MQVNLIYYLTATLLGGLHALEPGHGKTVVAAYLIGSKGRKIDAVVLGLVVTLTHTLSVILLAIAAKVASTRITLTEEALHGHLGIVAGLMILAVGIWMLAQRIRGREPFHFHSHDHGHGHSHSHDPLQSHSHPHDHSHEHDGDHNHREGHDLATHSSSHMHVHPHNHDHGNNPHSVDMREGKRVSLWQLFLLGVSGGLVPCPAAIAILLAAVGAGRLGEGLTYILLFSFGLAAVLIAIGIAVVSAGNFASRFLDAKRFARKVAIGGAVLVTFIGGLTLVSSVRHLI